ncbi:MAG: hypothetical protein JW730_04235 [Anaerolineales bacterium]|nr:hypothetical protein [Anaerolineales bacterium]
MIYRTDTKIWKTISAQIGNTEAYVQELFVSKDGSVWGQNAWTAYSNPSGIPVLSKYNKKEEKFELDKNVVSIPAAWRNSGGYDYWSNVLLDQSGMFWIVANNDAIFS